MHVDTHEMRVCKIYRKNELTPDLIKMIQKEIAQLTSLDHPNIIKCYEVLEDRNKIYIILENIVGMSLYEYVMENGELTEAQCATIAA